MNMDAGFSQVNWIIILFLFVWSVNVVSNNEQN